MTPAPRWTHQQEAFDFAQRLYARKRHGAMLAMVMGAGKSRVAAELATDVKARTLLILCPLRVIGVWGQQLARFAPHYHFVGLGKGAGASRTREAARYYAWSETHKQPLALAINYDAARVTPFAGWAATRPWDMVIADECVPAGTQISTPRGSRAIEELRAGDAVLGYDHEQRRVVETRVTNAFRGFNAGPRYRVGSTTLTSGHPVWTAEKHYAPASELKGEETVAYLVDRKLRMVPLRISERAAESGPILQPEVLGPMADVAPGVRQGARIRQPASAGDLAPDYETITRATRRAGEARGPSGLREQSREEPGESPKGDGDPARHGLPAAHRGQRSGPDSAAANLVQRASGVGYGISDNDADQGGAAKAANIESGSCHARSQAGNRGGWSEPLVATRETGGSEKGRNPHGSGVATAALYQQGNSAQPLIGDGFYSGDYRVFNVETETGNYFANGLLVHNSHRLKDPRGRASIWMAKLGLMAHRRLALTGTPMPHLPIDFWAQFRFIDPFHLDPTYAEFKLRYAVMGGFMNKVITEWRDLDDLERRFRALAFRVDESVLDLPPEMDEIRSTEMGEAGALAYQQMERDMITLIDGGYVTAANAMVKLLRLQQMTGGAATAESGELVYVDREKELLLQELLEDLDEPVVVFCRFRPDLEAVHRAARQAGHGSRELSGERDELAEWQAGGADALAVQIQAGGVGVDLTRARVAIYYSIGFSLADYLQSRARIRRPPQKRPCLFIHLQIRNSIDEYVLRAVEARGDLVDSVLKELKAKGAASVVSG